MDVAVLQLFSTHIRAILALRQITQIACVYTLRQEDLHFLYFWNIKLCILALNCLKIIHVSTGRSLFTLHLSQYGLSTNTIWIKDVKYSVIH